MSDIDYIISDENDHTWEGRQNVGNGPIGQEEIGTTPCDALRIEQRGFPLSSNSEGATTRDEWLPP